MPFDAADLAAFIDPDMPGYVLASINGQPVGALFRARYAEAFSIVGGTQPTLRCVDTVVAPIGTAVVVKGVSYTVADIEPESFGLQALKLEAV